jgi:Uma2 family endonuclease
MELTEGTMSEAIHTDAVVTVARFDAFLDSQVDDSLWELVTGRIVAMTNPTEVHEKIASNIGAPLAIAVDPARCHVYQGGIGVQRSDLPSDTYRTRPDVVVRCGRLGTRNFITDALVVVEVLSPSTIDVDRGEKLRFYKSLPTLRHIALVYQDQMRVEHYRKTDLGWEFETLTHADDSLLFDALAFAITLDRVYFGVEPTNVHRLAG